MSVSSSSSSASNSSFSPSSTSTSSQSQESEGEASSLSSSSSNSHYYYSSSNESKKINRRRRKIKYHKHPLILQNVITITNGDGDDKDDSSSSSSDSSLDTIGDLCSELNNYKTNNGKNMNTNDAQEINDLIAQVHDFESLNHQEASIPPPPPSFLSYLSQISSYQLSKNDSDGNDSNTEEEIGEERQKEREIHELHDTSALVSLGILSEEVITEMLLPLAQAHVTKCREIVSSSSTQEQQENYMQRLTIDPIEAVTELLIKQTAYDNDNDDISSCSSNNDISISKEIKQIFPVNHVQKWVEEEENNDDQNDEHFQDYKDFINALLSAS